MRSLPSLLFVLVATLADAGPDPALVALDRAEEALAGGDPASAVRVLSAALPRVDGDDADRVRCLLGHALLANGQAARAEQELAKVPREASCGLGAAWKRVTAFERSSRPRDAAALAEELAATPLGPDRDGATADTLARLARRLLDDPTHGEDQALALLQLAAGMRISDQRAADLAVEAWDAATAERAPAWTCDGLVRGLGLAEDAALRERAALACRGDDRRLLADGMADPGDRAWAEAWAHAAGDEATADTLRARALASTDRPERRATTAAWLADRGRVDAAPLLQGLGADEEARGLTLLASAGRWTEVVAGADAWLQAWPRGTARNTVENLRAVALLSAARTAEREGRHAEALQAYDELLARHPGVPEAALASWEAGVVARAAGDVEGARRRWEETRARYPDEPDRAGVSLARLRALDEGELEAAEAMLRGWSTYEASEELTRLRRTEIAIASQETVQGAPVVHLRTRNLDRVELRLHPIDAEAFVLAGGAPGTLGTLDVAAIAPDRTWTVEVPEHRSGAEVSFDAVVRVGRPGLYAVTAASDREEARALVSVGGLRAVARAVGPDVAVAAFDERGRPVAGADVLLVGQDRVEGRTDATGLFVHHAETADEVVALVRKGGEVALLPPLGHGGEPSGGLRLSAELDRPVYLPGDRVGVHLLAREQGRGRRGTWTLWLAQGEQALGSVRAEADEDGVVWAELRVPEGIAASSLTVRATPPDSSTVFALGTARLAPVDEVGTSLSARMDGTSLVAMVLGRGGAPLRDVPVLVDERVVKTDERGQASFDGPRAGLPWTTEVRVPGRRLWTTARREPAEAVPLEVGATQDRVRPGERIEVRIEGEGALELAVVRELDEAAGAPLQDPWVPEVVLGLRGFGEPEPEPVTVATEVVTRRALTAEGATTLSLDPLPAGRYQLRLTDADGATRSAAASLSVVADGLRLTGAEPTGVGRTLTLTPDGAPALLTAATDHLLWAAVRPAGRSARVAPDVSWSGEVSLAASGPGGEIHQRVVHADPDPTIELRTEQQGDSWKVVAEVRDAAGEPLDAEVVFAAWDERLLAIAGAPSPLAGESTWAEQRSTAPVGVRWGGPLVDTEIGRPVAAALLAEAELRREREKASRAGADGLFSDNALAGMLRGDLPVSSGGSFGAYGSGIGGGGSGYGMGGGVGSLGRASGTARDPGMPGVRERVLWTRIRTVAGRAEVPLDGPPARYRVRATAVSATGARSAEAQADLRGRVWLVAEAPSAGSAEDRASPLVTVVNGTDRPLEDRVLVDGAEALLVSVAPGSAHTWMLPERAAGPETVSIALGSGPSTPWRFPLAEGEPDDDGVLWVTAGTGPAALTRIALRPSDTRRDAWWWAQAGRAAVAAWTIRPEATLADRVADARDQLRLLPSEGLRDDAARALFLVEASRSGAAPVLRAEVDAALDAIAPSGPREDLVWAARALRAGGRVVDPALLEVIGTEDPPTPPTAPPPVGDPALVDWLIATAPSVKGVASGGALEVRRGDRPDGITWRASGLIGGDLEVVARRQPTGPDGVPVEASGASRPEGCDPCVLSVGDRIRAPWRLGAVADGIARVPGTYVLGGRRSDDGRYSGLQVRVVADAGLGVPSPTDPATAIAAAALWREAGVPTRLPESTDRSLSAALATEAFSQALLVGDAAQVAERFRVLLATVPDAEVGLDDVAAAARALGDNDDPTTAIRAWRAAVDASFVSEVANIAPLEQQVGLLVALRTTRDAALRQPEGRAVGDALYVLPGRLLDAADQGLPAEVAGAGITATDARLTAAAWDRSFLATHPDHPLATAAGLRLGRTLLTLHAPLPAHEWAVRVARAHPDDALQDALTFLDAAALTEAGSSDRAEPLLVRLAEHPFPGADGVPRASPYAGDARLALGRLQEARGRYDAALRIYRDVPTDEARQAAEVLTTRQIDTPALVRLGPGQPAVIDATLRGIDQLSLRAYRVDLRTVFLRDGGLQGVGAIEVDGVSPAWTDTRRTGAGPFPETRSLTLPLSGMGAWLVQLDGEDAHASTVIVRSDLRLAVDDHGGTRRVDLRRGDRAVAGAEVRALSGYGVVAALTDVRGVAEVPSGAPVLVWSGDAVAFTDPDAPLAAAPSPSPARGRSGALDGLDRQIRDQRQLDEDRWEDTVRGASEALPLRML
ncbi:MAG: hypothetical protein H6734_27740 [Alphaproteobacteria bacterium]|nr:hypothetical protein [Alphaproteobacteria bacterium]